MQRYEEEVAQHPDMLKEWALQEKLLHNLEGLQREIDLLAEVLRGMKR